MIYDMRYPSKNMLLPQSELCKMLREQEEEMEAKEIDKKASKKAKEEREKEERISKESEKIKNDAVSESNRAKFLSNVKEAFITECILKVYKESTLYPMSTRDANIAKNLVTKFVRENGANNIINNFATKNILLSEISRICTKYYNKVLEDCKSCTPKPGEVKEYNLDTTIKDDFYNELDTLDTADASGLIKDRVSAAIQDFVDTNSAVKMEYQDVIDSAKSQIAKTDDEKIAEGYTNIAKNKMNNIKLRDKSIFHVMVESLARKALTDDSYKRAYVKDAKVDMDKIVEDAQLIYTMLEMTNTTCMVNVDENFLNRYVKSLS